MDKSPRVHSPAFQAQVALAALKGDRTLSEIAGQFPIHVKLVQAWKKLMREQASTVFTSTGRPVSLKESEVQQAELFEQIGRFKMKLELSKKNCRLRVTGSGSRRNRAMLS